MKAQHNISDICLRCQVNFGKTTNKKRQTMYGVPPHRPSMRVPMSPTRPTRPTASPLSTICDQPDAPLDRLRPGLICQTTNHSNTETKKMKSNSRSHHHHHHDKTRQPPTQSRRRAFQQATEESLGHPFSGQDRTFSVRRLNLESSRHRPCFQDVC